MKRASLSSRGPLGTGRDWRRRLLVHHAPLGVLSAIGLIVLMSVSSFDTDRYPMDDLFSGSLPREFDEAAAATHTGPAETGLLEEANGEAPQREGRGHQRPDQHGAEPESSEPPVEQAERAEHNASGSAGGDFLGLSVRQFTFASGYVALVLLGLTLLVGPANLLLRRRRPISNYLARDVGMWAAVSSVVHVVYGVEVHAAITDPIPLFIDDGSPLTNSFGLANWTGLAATVLVVVLLAISSNFALRKLKARTWKNLQRLNYALFGLVLIHAFFYGALLRIESPFTALLLASAIAVLFGQVGGIWLWRRRHGRGRETPAVAATQV